MFLTDVDTSLRDLPTELSPEEIMEKIKERIEKNLINGPENPPEVDEKGKVIRLYGGGLFHEFEWMPDQYDRHLIKEREKKIEEKEK